MDSVSEYSWRSELARFWQLQKTSSAKSHLAVSSPESIKKNNRKDSNCKTGTSERETTKKRRRSSSVDQVIRTSAVCMKVGVDGARQGFALVDGITIDSTSASSKRRVNQDLVGHCSFFNAAASRAHNLARSRMVSREAPSHSASIHANTKFDSMAQSFAHGRANYCLEADSLDTCEDPLKKQVHVGNLPEEQIPQDVLESKFLMRFKKLPDFRERYSRRQDIICEVFYPNMGKYVFISFCDEVLASTAILMSGFMMGGRRVQIRRPVRYCPPASGELPPLNILPLRALGLIPTRDNFSAQIAPHVGMQLAASSRTAQRYLYIGNLNRNVDSATLTQFLTHACCNFPGYENSKGPPVVEAHIACNTRVRTYAFVQFRDADLASQVLRTLDGCKFLGREMRIQLPSTLKNLV